MMKAILAFGATGAVLAQNFSGEPACATSCLSSAIIAAGCQLTDEGCACSKTSSIALKVAPCLMATCDPADLSSAASVGSKLCSEYSKSHGLTAPAIASATATEDMDMAMTTTTTGATQLVTVTQGGSTVTMEWTIMTMGGSLTTMLMPVPTTSAPTTKGSSSSMTVDGSIMTMDGSVMTMEVGSTSSKSANAAATPAVIGVGALAALGLAAAF